MTFDKSFYKRIGCIPPYGTSTCRFADDKAIAEGKPCCTRLGGPECNKYGKCIVLGKYHVK